MKKIKRIVATILGVFCISIVLLIGCKTNVGKPIPTENLCDLGKVQVICMERTQYHWYAVPKLVSLPSLISSEINISQSNNLYVGASIY